MKNDTTQENLPEWLEDLWKLKPSLAREAEKDYTRLRKKEEILDNIGKYFIPSAG